MSLREKVCIKTPSGELRGELSVGADGLPELSVATPYLIDGMRYERLERLTPATFPAAWTLFPSHAMQWGVLYDVWTFIEAVRQEIRDAKREADAEDRDRAQQREIDNRIAQEIDERRS